jgi:hypothetical protein
MEPAAMAVDRERLSKYQMTAAYRGDRDNAEIEELWGVVCGPHRGYITGAQRISGALARRPSGERSGIAVLEPQGLEK